MISRYLPDFKGFRGILCSLEGFYGFLMDEGVEGRLGKFKEFQWIIRNSKEFQGIFMDFKGL